MRNVFMARVFAAALALLTLGPALLWSRLPGAGAAPAGPNYTAILQPLGRAYAGDYRLGLTRVQAAPAARITAADRAEWTARVEEALAVGYVPEAGMFEALPLRPIQGVMKLQMAGNRTPQQVVRSAVAPGNWVVQVTWTFGGARPVRSYALFSPRQEILFDSLLSLPVVYGPMVGRGH